MRVGALPAIQGPRDSPPVPGRRGAASFSENWRGTRAAREAMGAGRLSKRHVKSACRPSSCPGPTHALGAGPKPGEGRGSCGRGSSVAAHRIPGRQRWCEPNGPRSPPATTSEADTQADGQAGPLPRGRPPVPEAAAESPDKGDGRTSPHDIAACPGHLLARRWGVPAVEPELGAGPGLLPAATRRSAPVLPPPSHRPFLYSPSPARPLRLPASPLRGFPPFTGPVRGRAGTCCSPPAPPPGQDRSPGSAAGPPPRTGPDRTAVPRPRIRPPREDDRPLVRQETNPRE